MSTLSTHSGAGLAALVTIVAAAGYFLGIYRRAFLGPVRHVGISEALDLCSRELALVVVLAGLILSLGLWPSSVLDITRVASEDWVGHLK